MAQKEKGVGPLHQRCWQAGPDGTEVSGQRMGKDGGQGAGGLSLSELQGREEGAQVWWRPTA